MKFIGIRIKKETALLEAVVAQTPTVAGKNFTAAKILNNSLQTSDLQEKKVSGRTKPLTRKLETLQCAKVRKKLELYDTTEQKYRCSSVICVVGVWSKEPTKPRKKPYQKPQAVKKLEELADIENERKHPNTPPKYLAKSKYRDDTANGLTKCIIDFIRLNGGQAERINATGVPIDTRREVTDILGHRRTIGSVTWRPSGATVGSADISATVGGRSVKIEVKVGRDRQSEAQKQYQASIEAAGDLYFLANDFTDFVAWYHQNLEKGGAK